MEPDDLLCSRNARPQKALVGRAQWKINQPPSLRENEQAWKDHSDGEDRSMRAVKDGLPVPYGEGEEAESPRWTRAPEVFRDHFNRKIESQGAVNRKS